MSLGGSLVSSNVYVNGIIAHQDLVDVQALAAGVVKIKDTLVLNKLRTDLSLVRRWGPLSHESGIRTRILHSRSVLIVHSAILSFLSIYFALSNVGIQAILQHVDLT